MKPRTFITCIFLSVCAVILLFIVMLKNQNPSQYNSDNKQPNTVPDNDSYALNNQITSNKQTNPSDNNSLNSIPFTQVTRHVDVYGIVLNVLDENNLPAPNEPVSLVISSKSKDQDAEIRQSINTEVQNYWEIVKQSKLLSDQDGRFSLSLDYTTADDAEDLLLAFLSVYPHYVNEQKYQISQTTQEISVTLVKSHIANIDFTISPNDDNNTTIELYAGEINPNSSHSKRFFVSEVQKNTLNLQVPANKQLLIKAAKKGGYKIINLPVDSLSKSETKEIHLEFERGDFVLQGIVLDENNKPVEKARVCAQITGHADATAETNQNGEFVIQGLADPHISALFVHHLCEEHEIVVMKNLTISGIIKITLKKDDEASELKKFIKENYLTAAVRGICKDEEGNAISEAWITVIQETDPIKVIYDHSKNKHTTTTVMPFFNETSNASGYFEIPVLPSKKTRISVSKSGYKRVLLILDEIDTNNQLSIILQKIEKSKQ